MSTSRDARPSPARPHIHISLFSSILLLLLYFLTCTSSVTANRGKLLVVYIDGMRWDYIERRLATPYRFPDAKTASPEVLLREPTNGLFLMKRLGSFVKRVKPVFPTQCLPNIMSAFTGRFPPHHGMIGNQMYDAKSGFHFNYHRNENRVDHFKSAPPEWWKFAEPLWETLDKRYGRRTSIYNVPTAYELRELRRSAGAGAASGKGDNDKGSGEGQSVYYPYGRDMTWRKFEMNLLDAIGRLRRNITDLAVVYTDILDRHGHAYGPQSLHVERVMKQLDAAIHMALHEIHLEPSEANLHMMLLSDHGMQEISQTHSVNLDWYMLRSSIKKVVNDGTMAGIWPHPDRAQEVLERLRSHQTVSKGFTVHWHTDSTMERFFARNPQDSRIPPILVVASNKYVLITKEFPFPREGVNGDFPQEGLHGYHPSHDDMHTAMMVVGPQVHGGFEMSGLHMTEIYQLMCHLLGVPTQPHNGSFKRVRPLLRSWHPATMTTAAPRSSYTSSGVLLRPHMSSLLIPVLLLIFTNRSVF